MGTGYRNYQTSKGIMASLMFWSSAAKGDGLSSKMNGTQKVVLPLAFFFLLCSFKVFIIPKIFTATDLCFKKVKNNNSPCLFLRAGKMKIFAFLKIIQQYILLICHSKLLSSWKIELNCMSLEVQVKANLSSLLAILL